MNLQERIDDGIKGKYSGLANGFDRLNNYLFGIQKGIKILIGGDSGTYKTTLVDFMVLHAIEDAKIKGIELDIVYNSWEIDEITKKMQWLSNIIFRKHGIIIPPEKIKGLGNNRLNIAEQELVNQEIPYIEKMFSKINWSFTPVNPTGMFHKIWNLYASKGKFEYEDYVNAEGEKKQKVKSYSSNNPNYQVLMCTDHNYYYRKERGYGTKEVMDKASEYIVELSNLFGLSTISLQQFNDGLSAIDRQKFKGVDLSPNKTDFKDSRNFYQDSDICLGILAPAKVDLNKCLGYNIDKFGKYFLMLKIMKNRLQEDGVAIGLLVNPKSGTFIELPKADEFIKNPKLYEKYLKT